MGPDFLRLGNGIILVAHPGTHGDLMGRSRRQIEISDRQREILERLERAHSTEQQLARRVRMVLGCAEGRTNLELSIELGVHSQRVLRWRKRWFEAMPQLAAAEDEGATTRTCWRLSWGSYRTGTGLGRRRSSAPSRSCKSSRWRAKTQSKADCRSAIGHRRNSPKRRLNARLWAESLHGMWIVF